MKPKKRLRVLLPFHDNQGSVLIIAIWMVAILVVFVVSLSALVSNRLNSFKYFRDINRASLVATGSINKAIEELRKNAKSSWGSDALSESWNNNPEIFNEIKIGGGIATISHDYPQLTGGTITFYGCADEEQRININTAVTTVLETLFNTVAGITSESDYKQLARAIIDWRDTDSIIRPDGGAEDDYYMSLSPPYPCKNSNFETTEELLLVKGMTPEIYIKIKETITIYGSGKINFNTAPAPTLLALGASSNLIDKIYRFRAGNDGILGTTDDNIVTNEGELINRLKVFAGLTLDEEQLLDALMLSFTVKSICYRIKAKGTINNKKREILCIVRVASMTGAWQIIFWHEI